MIVTQKAFFTSMSIMGAFKITNLFHSEKSGDFSRNSLAASRGAVIDASNYRNGCRAAALPVDQRSARIATLLVWNMETISVGVGVTLSPTGSLSISSEASRDISTATPPSSAVNIRRIHQHKEVADILRNDGRQAFKGTAEHCHIRIFFLAQRVLRFDNASAVVLDINHTAPVG